MDKWMKKRLMFSLQSTYWKLLHSFPKSLPTMFNPPGSPTTCLSLLSFHHNTHYILELSVGEASTHSWFPVTREEEEEEEEEEKRGSCNV